MIRKFRVQLLIVSLLLLALPVSIYLAQTRQLLTKKAAPLVTRFTVEGKAIKMNGKVFIPKGLWGPIQGGQDGVATFPIVSKAGFNVVLVKYSPYLYKDLSLKVLDAARKNGLYVILSLQNELYAQGDAQVRINKAVAGVNNVKSHPALLGYLLGDEPDYKPESFASFLNAANLKVKVADPNHLTFTDLAKCESGSLYKNAADVIGHEHHIYIPKDTPGNEVDNLYAREIAGLSADISCLAEGLGEKLFWGVSFAFGNYNPPSGKFMTPRPPTPEEYESIYYQWLAGGATGIIPYTYMMTNWSLPSNSPGLWEKMKVLNQRQDALYPVLLNGKSIEVTGGRNSQYFKILGKTLGGKIYILAVNTTGMVLEEEFGIENSDALVGDALALWENKTLPISDSKIKDSFSPFAAKLYEVGGSSVEPTVSPTLPPDFSARPQIFNNKITQISVGALKVEWETDVPATSQVWYDTEYFNLQIGKYTTTPADISPKTKHTVTIIGLRPKTTYHLRVVSQNPNYLEDTTLRYKNVSPEHVITLKFPP